MKEGWVKTQEKLGISFMDDPNGQYVKYIGYRIATYDVPSRIEYFA